MPAAASSSSSSSARDHNDGSSTRTYTVEQKAAVLRVRKCSPTAFYDILGLETTRTTCTDSEIKKAYRKLSLLTHPDKNGYNGADEAFKMVSRAFGILSDPDKKSKFDRFGGDPDSRFGAGGAGPGGGGGGFGGGGGAASPFSGFRGGGGMGGGRGPAFEAEISPEEMFRQFFGGGGFGGPFGGGLFDTGPGFVFNMGGGPGVRIHQFGGGRPQRRPRGPNDPPPQPASPLSMIQSLLPLILIFIFPILSGLFNNIFSGPAGPEFKFQPAPPWTQQHTSRGLKIPYYVNPADTSEYRNSQWKELDKRVESRFVSNLQYECEGEREVQQRMFNEAVGFFFHDQEKIERARKMELKACRALEQFGISYRR